MDIREIFMYINSLSDLMLSISALLLAYRTYKDS
ncbi:MAG: hypothetical protein K0R34_1361 [Herbinix sp.]|jgi:hypothetical protein|nr:hypothetical protein [Herbinix sp.]